MATVPTRHYFELSQYGDLIVQGHEISVKIDSFWLTSDSSSIKDAYTAVMTTNSRGELCAYLPDHIPDRALTSVLTLYYPRVTEQPALTTAEWALALMLAMQWGLRTVRNLAMAALEEFLSLPADRAAAGVVLGVDEWVNRGMIELTQEVEPLGMTHDDVRHALRVKEEALLADLWS